MPEMIIHVRAYLYNDCIVSVLELKRRHSCILSLQGWHTVIAAELRHFHISKKELVHFPK